MSIYVLDTNIVSLIIRREPAVLAKFNAENLPTNQFIGCPFVWYEIRRGLLYRDAKAQMEVFLNLYSNFDWQDYAREDWQLAAEVWANLRTRGIQVADADLLIAIFARNRNAVLVTDNEADFKDTGATIENWKKPSAP